MLNRQLSRQLFLQQYCHNTVSNHAMISNSAIFDILDFCMLFIVSQHDRNDQKD